MHTFSFVTMHTGTPSGVMKKYEGKKDRQGLVYPWGRSQSFKEKASMMDIEEWLIASGCHTSERRA